ncbi:PREDICTED: uncharacterized protein LOC105556190 [Vollenhovia emeryi]|uniref:uncharacterized protein LOC105556190 n=1 Tax=Vollenhovia emeryi TaxID=411798 RepID=UPI0005F51582|nr:PREDICTED: uncharacterized protein LOC105556190 [Vollenhovia emeryi]
MHKLKKNLLNLEIFDTHRAIGFYRNLTHKHFNHIQNTLPPHILISIMRHHLISFNNHSDRLYQKHRKKINSLLSAKNFHTLNNIKPILIPSNSFDSQKNNNTSNNINIIHPTEFLNSSCEILKNTNEKWFINLTNITIPNKVSNLLQLGENFSLPDSLNKRKAIHEYIKDLESGTHHSQLNKKISLRNTVLPLFQNYINEKKLDPQEERLKHMVDSTTTFCKTNPDILFTRADKGNVTVAIEKNLYVNKMLDILNDRETYEIVKKDPSQILERKLNNILKNWAEREYISGLQHYQLKSSDTSLPRAYGLPKIHKDNYPLWIIISSINSPLHDLASFMNSIISKSLPPPFSHIDNSYDLFETLSEKTIGESEIFISLDVTSLFTNVPLELALESLTKRWNLIEKNTKIPKQEFLSTIKFILYSTYFTFNGIIYKQTHGTPMGSPISPLIADLVMQDLEETVLSDIHTSFYTRYVDDILLLTRLDSIEDILRKFNSYHNRLQFTLEIQKDHAISFLDLKINTHGNRVLID